MILSCLTASVGQDSSMAGGLLGLTCAVSGLVPRISACGLLVLPCSMTASGLLYKHTPSEQDNSSLSFCDLASEVTYHHFPIVTNSRKLRGEDIDGPHLSMNLGLF